MQSSVSAPRRRPRAALGQRWRACLVFATLLQARPHAVHAEEGPTPTIDRSATLFYEGRSLLNKGRFAEACEKFHASLALKRAAGTLLNVANCQQGAGDWVAALESVEAALSLAIREPDKRKGAGWMAAARDEIASLEPHIASLIVHSSAESAPAVTLDGMPLINFDMPLRLNPGRHRLEAAAPRRTAFLRDLELAAGQAETVVIPELELDAPPPPMAESSPPLAPSESLPALRVAPAAPEPSIILPWSLIAVGAAVFVGGGITGLVAVKLHADLKRDCPDRVCEGDLSERDHARTTALVADVLMGGGLVAGGIGAALLLTGSAPSPVPVALACAPGSCATYWRGTF